MISASIICDSLSPFNIRLTTFQLRYPKFIHGEAKTHRIIRITNEGGIETEWELWQEVGLMDDPNFSRNASSSRAVPTAKLIEEVRSDALRATPVSWGQNQKGMQAGDELTGDALLRAQACWRSAALDAANWAERMAKAGAHKQVVNRVLEPFTHINVVCTATEYMNFFGLRLDEGAQPEIRVLAEKMWWALAASTPKPLALGQWHLPYVDDDDLGALDTQNGYHLVQEAIRVSVARCARVSYLSFETGRRSTIEEDLRLYDRLVGSQPLHASPAEHPATPDSCVNGVWMNHDEHGNFVGFRQWRKMLPGEAIAPLPTAYRGEDGCDPRQAPALRGWASRPCRH